MPLPPSAQRSQLRFSQVVFLLALILGLVFAVGFLPAAQRADRLDQSLRQAWDSFARTNQSSAATAGVAEDQLLTRLLLLEHAAADLSGIRRLAFDRVDLPPEVADHLHTPFQLIDFDNARLQWTDRLAALAKAQKVQLAPAALSGLPEYPSESAPALLWPRLHFATQVLLTAIRCQVGSIQQLTQLPPLSHRSLVNNRRLFEEMPMRLELVGPVEPLARFLTSLPLRGSELEATGLVDVLTNKPALFLSHILLRKAAPDRPNDARLELVVSGFVPVLGPAREPSPGPR